MTFKKIYFSIYIKLFLCFLYGFVINTIYRPYIYKHNIPDCGLADVGNNIIFIPTTYYIIGVFNKKKNPLSKIDVIKQVVILSFLEIISAFVPHIGTFDIKDVFALIIGAVALLLFEFDKLKKE
ncbi:hypothetical protein [Flavobacterium xanthum]|uniref:VanZ like family protein n=1 Tax=Flavobacterium xanthum TaxID=69322 RepID=A0A1M7FXP7_9FLAO|nr:hypothetical protein [Flavobacterium xanthum]SHM08831.1 hypothetical protein SAMN05443669_102179 [Flavobacterium xanthum]